MWLGVSSGTGPRPKQDCLPHCVSFPRLEVPEADGAMYLFLRVTGQEDSLRLAKQLIEEVGLGLAPGRAFGPEGEGWLRWCYAADVGRKSSPESNAYRDSCLPSPARVTCFPA